MPERGSPHPESTTMAGPDSQQKQPDRGPTHVEFGSWGFIVHKLRAILLVVLGVGLVTNFLFFSAFRDFYTPDSASYVESAGSLAKGHGFTDRSGNTDVTRTPGYPVLIVPFLWMDLELKYLIIFQHFLQILIALATVVFAYQVSNSRKQALIAGLLICIDLPSLNAANTFMTEIFFTATLLVAVWLLWGTTKKDGTVWWLAGLAGLLGGWSVLIRPITMYFFLPAAAYLLLTTRRHRWRAAAIFFVAFSALPLGWMVRNYVEDRYFSMSSIQAWNMLGYRAAAVLAINDPGDFSLNLEKRQNQLLQDACDSMQTPDRGECLSLTIPQKAVPEKAQAYMELGRSVVLHHPVAYAEVAARGAAMMMLGGDADVLMKITGKGPRGVKALILIYTVPACLLAMVGLYVFWNKERSFFYLAALLVGYFLIVSTGAEAYSRMRVPIMPIYVMLVAAGIEQVLRRFWADERRTDSLRAAPGL